MRTIKKSIPWKNRILAAMSLLLLAAVLCNVSRAQAAEKVDMEQKGTLALYLPEDDMVMDMALIKGADAAGELKVHAWKLADMLETGKYELSEEFRGLGLGEDAWGEVSASEDGWRELSRAAMDMIYELDEDGNPVDGPMMPATYDNTIHVAADGTIAEAETFSGMDLGLYLVVVDEAQSPGYAYSFTPMIVSLPWSEYQYEGTADDTWQYAREAFLKPAQQLRYGSIRITKELTDYNVSQGDVTFVFDVVARESEDPDSKIVYSNVVSLTFSTAGIQEAVLEHIPAGAVVTVTEVYSGANCELTDSPTGSRVVTADGEEGSPITFSFENRYDEEAKNGYGVENRFRYDTERNTYQWTTDRPDIGDGAVGGNETEAGE